MTGKTLAAVSAAWSLAPVDAALRVIQADDSLTDVASFNMSEGDIRLLMKQPWVVTSSDGSDGHPRQYASFPMKYSKYVRDEKVIDLGEFIRSSSGRTADIFRLDRRGYLKAGNFADVVVIDIAKYSPGADYVHPRVLAGKTWRLVAWALDDPVKEGVAITITVDKETVVGSAGCNRFFASVFLSGSGP